MFKFFEIIGAKLLPDEVTNGPRTIIIIGPDKSAQEVTRTLCDTITTLGQGDCFQVRRVEKLSDLTVFANTNTCGAIILQDIHSRHKGNKSHQIVSDNSAANECQRLGIPFSTLIITDNKNCDNKTLLSRKR